MVIRNLSARINLVSLIVRHLLKRPVQVLGVERQEKEVVFVACRKHVDEDGTAIEGVVEADFLDAVEMVFPLDEAGGDFAGSMVINKINRNFFANFGNHRLKLYLTTE